MFKLFAKSVKKESVAIAEHTSLLIPQYSEDVQKIHNEFFTACDKALESANNILKEAAAKSSVKAKELELLGFTSVPEVKISSNAEQLAKEKENFIGILRYYRDKYPLQKYITEQDVEAICKKYNLVIGPVGIYKGFVPEKNLNDIKNAYIQPSDIKYKIGSKYRDSSSIYWDNGVKYNQYPGTYDKVLDRNLQICAPIKDMQTSSYTLNGYKLEQAPPDPVVLQPVNKGGYLILTAWGDEASDPLVVNELNN